MNSPPDQLELILTCKLHAVVLLLFLLLLMICCCFQQMWCGTKSGKIYIFHAKTYAQGEGVSMYLYDG